MKFVTILVVEKRSRWERERFKFNKEPGGSGYGKEAKTFFAGISMSIRTDR